MSLARDLRERCRGSRLGSASSPFSSAREKSWPMMEINAERVLPDPVGEQMRAFLPCRIRGHSLPWTGCEQALC